MARDPLLDDLMLTMRMSGISKSQVSRLEEIEKMKTFLAPRDRARPALFMARCQLREGTPKWPYRFGCDYHRGRREQDARHDNLLGDMASSKA